MKETIKESTVSDNTVSDNSKKTPDTTKSKPKKKKKTETDSYREDSLELATLTQKERIRYRYERYKERIADMPFKTKLFYTIDYYKWYFAGLLLVLLLVAFSVKVIYNMSLPTPLRIAIVNSTDAETPQVYIPKAYRAYYNLDDKNDFQIYSNLCITAEKEDTQIGVTMSDYQTLGYYNMNDMIDAIIVDETALKMYVSSDDTTAIDLSMDEALYKQIEEYTVTLTDTSGVKNEGKPYQGAIDISGTDFAKGCNLSYQQAYLLIPSTKYTDNERTLQLIRMIFDIKQ